MTEEQIERAARRLCELQGIDPDADAAPLFPMPAWKLARDEVIRFWSVARAVHFAVDGEDLP